jgi:hypothetical protein
MVTFFLDIYGLWWYNTLIVRKQKDYEMTRKDFEMIAETLFETKTAIEVVKVWADRLASTNSRFDRDRFILAAMNWS